MGYKGFLAQRSPFGVIVDWSVENFENFGKITTIFCRAPGNLSSRINNQYVSFRGRLSKIYGIASLKF